MERSGKDAGKRKAAGKPTVIVLERTRRVVVRPEAEPTPPAPATEARQTSRKIAARLRRLHPMD